MFCFFERERVGVTSAEATCQAVGQELFSPPEDSEQVSVSCPVASSPQLSAWSHGLRVGDLLFSSRDVSQMISSNPRA